uniref:Nuclear valosin-containing protein-like n=1 Tax=Schistocephalus solidus TaxID=70667 RepID=A0A183S8L4_SCHSO
LDYVLKDGKTNCRKDNIKNWRKDALKSNISCLIPSLLLSDLSSTIPDNLKNQANLLLKCHLFPSGIPDVWPSILVNGPPFCGKTTLVKAVAGVCRVVVYLLFQTLRVNFLSVSVGMLTPTIRTWREIFNQAKANSPCLLHIDDIESMEKQSAPSGTFRLTCLLKSQLLPDCIGSGVVVVGETRNLLASLPQPVTDLFTHRITFGMMEEKCRLSLLSKFLTESPLPPANGDTSDVSLSSNRNVSLVLDKGLTLAEIAHRTPGYEAGDLVRLILQLRIALLSAADNGMDTDVSELMYSLEPAEMEMVEFPDFVGVDCPGLRSIRECRPDNGLIYIRFGDSTWRLGPAESLPGFADPGTLNSLVTRDVLEVALSQVVPAAKNTSEFVTIPEVTWSDVGGLEETKTHLYNRFMLLVDDWERAQTLRRRSGGVLLEGPPGCGKTLIAKALSNTAGLNFLSVKGPEILNKYQGESERRVREIFERARACQPCLVFFDEIDAICPRRDGDESSGSRVSVVNQLLVELDGIDKHRQARVFVVGATNRKDMIDEAVLRPGRLGLHLFISPPASASDRASVLSACTRGATAPLIEGGLTALNRLAEDPRTNNMT